MGKRNLGLRHRRKGNLGKGNLGLRHRRYTQRRYTQNVSNTEPTEIILSDKETGECCLGCHNIGKLFELRLIGFWSIIYHCLSYLLVQTVIFLAAMAAAEAEAAAVQILRAGLPQLAGDCAATLHAADSVSAAAVLILVQKFENQTD